MIVAPTKLGKAATWLLVVLTLAACSEAGIPHPPSGTITDSAGVRIVSNSDPLWGAGESWRVTSEPMLALGVVDTTPVVQQFHRIEGVTRLSDGTIVVLNTGSGQLRAFDSIGRHRWSAGGLGFGPGEMNDHQGKRLLRLPGDTLLVISELDWITFDRDGQLVDDRREPGEDGCKRLTIPTASDRYLECHETKSDRVPGPVTGVSHIVRIARDRVDSIGPFFLADGWRSHSGRVRTIWSPLGPKGTLRFARNEPVLLYARNDAYRIEFWDLAAGTLSMVVGRRTPRRARTKVEVAVAGPWGPDGPMPLGVDDDRLSVVDSLSIVADFFLDELGFLWVQREPSPSEGDEGIPQEVFTPDGRERIGTIRNPSGLHDVFRPDGVYLGTVKLPRLGWIEIGADHVLGTSTDEWGIQYVRMFGLERGNGVSRP